MVKDIKAPEEWRRVKLGEVCSIKTGKRNVQDADEYGIFPLFDRSGEVKQSNSFLFDCEAVIVPGEGVEFVPKYFEGKFDLHQRAYAIFDLGKEIDGKFLYYTVFNYRSYFSKSAVGSTVKSLRLPILSNFDFIIPSLSEQYKIAEILETVDNAIEKTDAIIEKYKRIKQGLMQDLLTKGIDENWQIRNEKTHKFRDSLLGRIPEEWKVVEVGEVVDINPEKVNYSITPQIKYIDIESVIEGKVINYKTFNSRNAPSRAQRLIRENDVIISTVRPNLKAFFIVTKQFDNFVCSTGFAVLRNKDNRIHPSFLFYISLYDDIFLKQILPMIVGSNYPAINSTDVYIIKIPLPPLPEQHRIATVLSQIDEVIEKERAYREKLERIKKGLMDDLLTGKVRVNCLIEEADESVQQT
jgi:type I restriction enzyme S subunit